jgi:hypothetical protein
LLPQRRRRGSAALPIAPIVIVHWYEPADEIRFNLLIIWQFAWMRLGPTKRKSPLDESGLGNGLT